MPRARPYELEESGYIFQNQYMFFSSDTVADNCIMKLSVFIYTMYFCVHQARKNSSVQQLSLYFLLISVLSASVIIHQLTPALAETKGSDFMPKQQRGSELLTQFILVLASKGGFFEFSLPSVEAFRCWRGGRERGEDEGGAAVMEMNTEKQLWLCLVQWNRVTGRQGQL